MLLLIDILVKLYIVFYYRKKGSKKCNGYFVNIWDKMINFIKNMYIFSIYYNKIIIIVNNKWNVVEYCILYKICIVNIFFFKIKDCI